MPVLSHAADAGALKICRADGHVHLIAGFNDLQQVGFLELHKGNGCFAVGQGGVVGCGREALLNGAHAIDVLGRVLVHESIRKVSGGGSQRHPWHH